MNTAEQLSLGFVPLERSYDCCLIEVDEDHLMLSVYNKGYHPSKNELNHQYKKLKSFLKAMGEDTEHVDEISELARLARKYLRVPVGGKFWSERGYSIDIHTFYPIR